jgi:hypothetical protein
VKGTDLVFWILDNWCCGVETMAVGEEGAFWIGDNLVSQQQAPSLGWLDSE